MRPWPLREVVLLVRNLISVMAVIAVLFAVMPDRGTRVHTILMPATQAAEVQWGAALQRHFPDCRARLPGTIPGSVVEVRNRIPLRVDFADAWERAHDGDRTNNGPVIAVCTRRIGS
jgi:hypothetical protein